MVGLTALAWAPQAHPQTTIVHPRYAQYLAPRQYMRRLGPQVSQPAPAARPLAKPQPASTNAVAPLVSPTPPPVPSVPVADPEKAREEKEAVARKTAEFVRQRAEGGSASAQYDLGKRYMIGDGVEKNFTKARQWLQASAKQGNEMAVAKLAELAKLEKEATAPATAK